MTIKAGHSSSPFFLLSNRVTRKNVTGDWSQSILYQIFVNHRDTSVRLICWRNKSKYCNIFHHSSSDFLNCGDYCMCHEITGWVTNGNVLGAVLFRSTLFVQGCLSQTKEQLWYLYGIAVDELWKSFKIQSNFNGSNTFGTMENCSSHR